MTQLKRVGGDNYFAKTTAFLLIWNHGWIRPKSSCVCGVEYL